jgi:hypothetical protein
MDIKEKAWSIAGDFDYIKKIVGSALEIGRTCQFSAPQLYDLEIIAALSLSGQRAETIRETFGEFVAETVALLYKGKSNFFDYVSRIADSDSKYAMCILLAMIKFTIPNIREGEKDKYLFAERMIYDRLN